MPVVTFQLNKGPFLSVDSTEIGSPDVASLAKNCFLTLAGSLINRPGLELFAQVGVYPILGLSYFGSYVVVVTSDRRIYAITAAGVVTEITGTDALEGSSRPTFAQDGTYLAIAGGGAPKVWNGSGNTTAMAGSPPDCTQIVFVDGYWVAIDGDDVVWAGPTEALRATWDATNFFQAEALPDSPLAIAVSQREIFVAGQRSIEIFQNVGDSAVPFRRSGAITGVGIGAVHSFIEADNTLGFLDSERNFRQFQGRNPVNISTPQIDRVIKGFSTVSDCWGAHVDHDGSFNMVWTFPTERRTFAYDYLNRVWREWDGYVSGISSRFRGHSHVFVPNTEKHFFGDYNTGKIWEFTKDAGSDGDHPRRVLYESGHIDHGTGNRKRNKWYRLHVKRGLGTVGGTEPLFLVQFRDDDGEWRTEIEMGLGFIGENNHTIQIFNTGIYRKRQIRIFMTDPYNLVLSKIEEDVEVMGS